MITCIKCNQVEAGSSWNGLCSRCVNQALLFPNREKELEQAITQKQEQISQLEAELATERETTQQALTTAQEWHERQKEEIIAE